MNTTIDHPDIEKLPLEIDSILVRETIRNIFRNPENGRPDNISKAGCLALALESNQVGGDGKGYLVWNAWREVFRELCSPHNEVCLQNGVDFSGIDFSDYGKYCLSFHKFNFGSFSNFSGADFCYFGVNFSDANFGESTNFQKTSFASDVKFSRAIFGGNTQFNDAKFAGYSYFLNTCFGNETDFSKVHFKGDSNFKGANFGSNVKFKETCFSKFSNFNLVKFNGDVDFKNTKFVDFSRFIGTQFGNAVCFEFAQFGIDTKFYGAQFGVNADFRETVFQGDADFSAASWEKLWSLYPDDADYQRAQQWAEQHDISPDVFQSIDFSGSTFEGSVNFSNRKFLNKAYFGSNVRQAMRRPDNRKFLMRGEVSLILNGQHFHTTFGQAPVFHGCELPQNTSFGDAIFPPASGSEEATRAYRTLKLAFSKQQAVREEQRFFRLEMSEERIGYWNRAKRALHNLNLLLGFREGFIWFFHMAYSVLSDYGSSVIRPLLLLVGTGLIFASIYGSYSSGVSVCALWQDGCNWQGDWVNFSLQQALPLPGFDKLDLAIKNVSVVWLFLHKTISLAALFLLGLALRNLFKLK